VGRNSPDAGDRGTPGYRREWQESFRPKKIDNLGLWKVFGSVISLGSGQIAVMRIPKQSVEWLIKRLIKVGAGVSYHSRRWYVYVASAFPLAQHYQAVLALVLTPHSSEVSGFWGCGMPKIQGRKYVFRESCAIMQSTIGFGFKNRNFGDILSNQEVEKTIFLKVWPQPPHNV
jgi:hypothetical protein